MPFHGVLVLHSTAPFEIEELLKFISFCNSVFCWGQLFGFRLNLFFFFVVGVLVEQYSASFCLHSW